MAWADGADGQLLDNSITRWITRWHRLLLCLPMLYLLLPFNGRWRIGLDSSQYRGLALSLAHHKGYTFGDWSPNQIYPGYPLILAGIEKLLGPGKLEHNDALIDRLIGPSAATTASVLFSMACAAATLAMVYVLLKRRYAVWVATAVTCGVGCSRLFVEQAHALMTDMPFLAAIVLTLLGWDSLSNRTRRRGLWAAATFVGMFTAALLRPMIWVLLIAWLIVCVIGLVRGPRQFYAGCLAALLVITGLTLMLRPKGYEYEAHDVLFTQLPSEWKNSLFSCLNEQLPHAVFGEQLRPLSILASLMVLGSALLFVRRHLLWTLLVFGTFAVTILLSDEPRYWLMILPILMLGWLMLFCRIAGFCRPKWGVAVLLVGIAMVGLNNLSACVAFFVEQHRGAFIEHYKHGEYVPTIAMAKTLQQKVRPHQKVLGPSGAILSILSGVHVYTAREVQPRGQNFHTPEAFARVGFDYVIFPAALYRQKEPLIQRLIDRHIILMRQAVAHVDVGKVHMILATARFSVPPGDWRFLPRGWRPPTPATRPVRRVKRPTTRQVRANRAAARRAAARRAATSRAATRPTTAITPASLPSR